MRGKRAVQSPAAAIIRITPADAGKTFIPSITLSACRDHPRGCGENRAVVEAFEQYVGSPPRMRGKLNQGNYAIESCRITPAGAGKT